VTRRPAGVEWDDDVLATAALIRHFSALGLVHDGILMETARTEREQFRLSACHVVTSFAVVYLLRALRENAPEAADEVARGLWTYLSGGEVAEWLHEWARREGVDVDRIPEAVKEALDDIRGRSQNRPGNQRRLVERTSKEEERDADRMDRGHLERGGRVRQGEPRL